MSESTLPNPLRNLSYSGILQVHSCPKKFQLQKLQVTQNSSSDIEADQRQNVTFAFGHAVGAGIQMVFEGKSKEQITWKLFIDWYADLFDIHIKARKSYWFALAAVYKFMDMREHGYLAEYEVATFNGRPAIELSFRLAIGNEFYYRGHVDVVLKQRYTGALLVLELKTNGSTTVNPATYKNSGQAIGYSIILDTISPGLSQYEVEYLVYSTPNMEYLPLTFPKALVQRALWIQELLLDARTIAMYEEMNIFPMHGESCFSWYRECEYYGICNMDVEMLKNNKAIAMAATREAEIQYQLELSIMDLIVMQQDRESFNDSVII